MDQAAPQEPMLRIRPTNVKRVYRLANHASFIRDQVVYHAVVGMSTLLQIIPVFSYVLVPTSTTQEHAMHVLHPVLLVAHPTFARDAW